MRKFVAVGGVTSMVRVQARTADEALQKLSKDATTPVSFVLIEVNGQEPIHTVVRLPGQERPVAS